MKRVIRSDKPVNVLLLFWSHKCDIGAGPRSRIIATSAVRGLRKPEGVRWLMWWTTTRQSSANYNLCSWQKRHENTHTLTNIQASPEKRSDDGIRFMSYLNSSTNQQGMPPSLLSNPTFRTGLPACWLLEKNSEFETKRWRETVTKRGLRLKQRQPYILQPDTEGHDTGDWQQQRLAPKRRVSGK
jgi:hypothetical protein